LSSIEDDAFVEELAQEVKVLQDQVAAKENEALAYVEI
jgi:hypothetical protein